MRARDVMTAHPSVITPDDTILKAAQLMRDRHVGLLPVIDNLVDRHLKGVITDRDIVVRCFSAGHGPGCTVKEHMTAHHLTTVRMDDSVVVVAHKMKRDHLRRVPVLADGGGVVGVIALVDLASRLRQTEPEMAERFVRGTAVHVQMTH